MFNRNNKERKDNKSKQEPREPCGNNIRFNIHVMRILDLEEKKYSLKQVFEEEMAEDFPVSSRT